MRLPADKRFYFLPIVVAVIAIGVIWWLGRVRELSPAEAAARIQKVSEDLGSESSDVSLSVNVVMPEGIGAAQRFEATGVVDPSADAAALTYDFSKLINAGGAFGALQEFDVVFDGDTVYVEIFQDGPPWISFLPKQTARRDVERLRELVLASPLVLSDLLREADSATGTIQGEDVHVRALAGSATLLRATKESSSAMLPLLDELAISEIPVAIHVTADSMTVDHELSFAIAPGAVGQIVVEVSTEFRRTEAPSIEMPAGSEIRALEDFLR